MFKKLIILAILVSFLIGCSEQSTEKVSSSLKFEEGFTQTLVFETKTNASQMGSFQEMNEVQFTLLNTTKDSNYVFTGMIKRMQYESEMFGEKESFDTEMIKSAEDAQKLSSSELELYNEMKGYLNAEFEITIDKYGNVLESAQFKNALTGDPTIVAQYSPTPIIYPEKDLTKGIQWNFETSNPILDSQKIKYTYTVDAVTNDKVLVDVSMTIDGIGNMLKESKAEGQYEIDRNTRQFIKGERTMKLQTGGGTATYKIYRKN